MVCVFDREFIYVVGQLAMQILTGSIVVLKIVFVEYNLFFYRLDNTMRDTGRE